MFFIINHIIHLMEKIDFPTEAKDFFCDIYKKLSENDIAHLDKLTDSFFTDDITDEKNMARCDEIQAELSKIADKIGCHSYSMDMLFMLISSKKLMKNYESSPLPISYFYEIMKDLTYKLYECKAVYNIYGIFTFFWFQRHYLMKLFPLGRFQFEKNEFKADSYTFGDITLKKGDVVYSFHIPSSGAMTKEMRYDSYKKAFEFFNCKEKGYIPIVCESWLLYPNNREFYPEKSNLYDFTEDFDILYGYEFENAFPDSWRIFSMDFNGDTSILPKETTLQKNIAKYLDSGRKIGNGYGLILFDGEKILNK